jgi:Rrf2 family nitric oxide-sensitive transcriptional repressor
MRLTLHTDYALRVLTYVGAAPGGRATIQEIADGFGVSRGHIMKVAYQLGQKGYLETVRGKGGGLRLAAAPASINIGAVVRDMEDLDVIGCLPRREGYCRIEGCCVLRRALRKAARAFVGALAAYTLEDLLSPRAQLAQLFGLTG